MLLECTNTILYIFKNKIGRVQQCKQCGDTFLYYASLYTHKRRCVSKNNEAEKNTFL